MGYTSGRVPFSISSKGFPMGLAWLAAFDHCVANYFGSLHFRGVAVTGRDAFCPSPSQSLRCLLFWLGLHECEVGFFSSGAITLKAFGVTT